MNRQETPGWLLVAVLIAALGCDDGGGKADNDAGADGGTDGGGELAVNARVFDSYEIGFVPAGGAVVTLDAPGGERVTQVADANGETVFTGIDWSAGEAAVTAHLEDGPSHIATRVGLTEADDPVDVRIYGEPLEDLVAISGTAANMAAEDDMHTFTATVYGSTYSQQQGPDWQLLVPAGEPFELVGCDWTYDPTEQPQNGVVQHFEQWAVAEFDAQDDTATLDFDFAASSVAPTSVEGSFSMPEREDSPLRTEGSAYVMVKARDDVLAVFMGAPTWGEMTEDGSAYEYTLEHIELASVAEPLTYYYVYCLDSSCASWVLDDGYPADGPAGIVLPDVPRITTPAEGADPHPLHEPVEWELYDSDVHVLLNLMRGTLTVWTIDAPVDATSLTVPELPDGLDAEDVFGSGTVLGQLMIYRPDEDNVILNSGATTRRFQIGI